MTTNKKIAVLAVSMALVLLLSACAPTPFRLHVIANSDSDEDQQVKMKVRDAVLEVTKDGIFECENAQEAQEYIEDNLEIIEKTAKETLAENKFDYSATAQVGTFHFPEKTYQSITYPEGDYQALEVTLGKGDGHNWWCVMFPPLCLTEIEVLDENETQVDENETQVDENETQVEYTSFFAELIEELFE